MTTRNLRNKLLKFISPTNLEYSNYSNWRVYKCFEKWSRIMPPLDTLPSMIKMAISIGTKMTQKMTQKMTTR